MNWTLAVQVICAIVGLLGSLSGLFFYRKYKAEVGKTEAETSKLSAEALNDMLRAFRDATAEFKDQRAKIKSEWEAERAEWQAERERWKVEREAERAEWKEKEARWQKERTELTATIQSGSSERKAIKAALDSLKLQVEVFKNLPEQIRSLELALSRVEGNGPPSKG